MQIWPAVGTTEWMDVAASSQADSSGSIPRHPLPSPAPWMKVQVSGSHVSGVPICESARNCHLPAWAASIALSAVRADSIGMPWRLGRQRPSPELAPREEQDLAGLDLGSAAE
jgi:hypothetical protein